jgi:hypothetical protein
MTGSANSTPGLSIKQEIEAESAEVERLRRTTPESPLLKRLRALKPGLHTPHQTHGCYRTGRSLQMNSGKARLPQQFFLDPDYQPPCRGAPCKGDSRS